MLAKRGAIKGAIKTLRPMLKPLVSLTITIKKGAMFKNIGYFMYE